MPFGNVFFVCLQVLGVRRMFRLVVASLVVGQGVPPLELLHSGLGLGIVAIRGIGLLRLVLFLVGGAVLLDVGSGVRLVGRRGSW